VETVWYAISRIHALACTSFLMFRLSEPAFFAFVLSLRSDAGTEGRWLAAIGPYWNGNEVWLIASGGLPCVCLPERSISAGFSGLLFATNDGALAFWYCAVYLSSFVPKEENSLWRTFLG